MARTDGILGLLRRHSFRALTRRKWFASQIGAGQRRLCLGPHSSDRGRGAACCMQACGDSGRRMMQTDYQRVPVYS